MAKRRPEDPPKGAPAWQSTFSDLMNLLLCFFVLLFSMSTVDAEKFQLVIASLTSSVSVLPGGSTSIGDGRLVGAGVSQLEFWINITMIWSIPNRQLKAPQRVMTRMPKNSMSRWSFLNLKNVRADRKTARKH